MRKSLVCFVLTTSLLNFACAWPQPQNKNSTATTEVNITAPADGGKVIQTEMVKGTSKNIPSVHVIWVVVFIHGVGRYYPQNQPADVQANGDWASVSYFGIPTDKDLKMDAIAVLADAAGQKAFQDYLREARDNEKYPGMERLPDSVKIYSRISVTRQ